MNKYKIKKVYETNTKSVFKISVLYASDRNKVLANGLPLVESFHRDWFVVDGKLEKVVFKRSRRINERYELKNKDLYNEQLPLLVDKHSKEKYKEIVKSDLYEFKYDNEDYEEIIPIEETVIINEDVPFMEKTHKITKKEGYGYNSEWGKPFLINLMEFHTVDSCLYPFPLKNLTRPVMITSDTMFIILCDYIASLGNKNYRIVALDDSKFEVNTHMKGDRIIMLENYTFDSRHMYQRAFQENYYAQNYTELIKKIKKLGNKIDKLLENRKTKEIKELIFNWREENSYANERK